MENSSSRQLVGRSSALGSKASSRARLNGASLLKPPALSTCSEAPAWPKQRLLSNASSEPATLAEAAVQAKGVVPPTQALPYHALPYQTESAQQLSGKAARPLPRYPPEHRGRQPTAPANSASQPQEGRVASCAAPETAP